MTSKVVLLLFQTPLFAQAPAPQEPGSLLGMLLPLMVILALAYFMFVVPQKRREKELRAMVQNLKENDRVVTIGGIFGVVTNVQREADRVTIRVDEATGTKLKVGMSAIARVLTGEETDSGGKAASKS